MIQIKKLIAQMFSKKSIKVWSVFLIFGFVFVAQAYAATDDITSNIAWFFDLILAIASWIWIILATMAGKLMTNDLLYWSFFHLDASLWTLWNIIKNFANFALWFIVLFAILKNIISPFSKWSDKWKPISVIKNTLIAGILIQSSWFLMWAVVDLSTIMTSAIGSFPAQFIASDQEFQWDMQKSLWSLTKWKFIFDPANTGAIAKWEPTSKLSDDPDEMKKILDTITPSYDSVAGPLLFLGFSVFELNNVGEWNSPTSGVDNWSDLFLSIWISAIVLIFFSLMMLLLFILNLFRILVLWIIIPLLPGIIILKVFGFDVWKGGIWELTNIRNILMLIFKPVLMVWTLSLILVMLVLIKNMISPPWSKTWEVLFEDQWNVSIVTTAHGQADDALYDSTMSVGWLMEFNMVWLKNTLADIIVYFFGLFLVFFLVKMTATKWKTGIWFIDNSVEWIFSSFEKIVTNLPIIPIWSGGVWVKALFGDKSWDTALTRMAGIDVADQTRRVTDLFGWGDFDTLSTHSWYSRDNFISEAHRIANNMSYSAAQISSNRTLESKIKLWESSNPNQKISMQEIIDWKSLENWDAPANNTSETDSN